MDDLQAMKKKKELSIVTYCRHLELHDDVVSPQLAECGIL